MLPKGYTRVEWIQSTGTQYINTRYKPNNNTRLVMECTIENPVSSNYITLFGARDADLARCFALFVSPSNNFYPNIGIKTDYYTYPSSLSVVGHHVIDANKNTITIDGNSHTFTARAFQNTTELFVFANNENNNTTFYGAFKTETVKIYDNGTLVRDYIPCRNPDGEAGLYDLVGGRFYGNDGTGEFVCGRAVEFPAHYKRLAYIESTGTQYIDTGFKPNQNSRIIMDCLLTSTPTSNAALFGARNGSSAEFWTLYRASSSKFAFRYGGSGTNHFIAGAATERHSFDLDKNTMTVDDAAVTVTSATFSSTYNAYLFAVNDAGSIQYPASVRLYRCQIYDNGTLARDYIPCIDENGDANLWDDVEEALAEKVGTFIAGPVVPTVGDLNTLLLLHGADVTDASPYERKLTNYGVTASDAQSKFGGKSLYFNGSSYMRIDDIDILPATGDFTIDWWEYRTASSEGSVVFHQPVKAKDGTGTIFGYGYQGLVNAYIGNTSGSFNIMPQTSMGAEVINKWVHRAVVRSGNQFLLFADGILQNSVTSSAALARNVTPYIGRYDSGNYLYYQGYIDEFRISDVARWTANFTPPTAEYNPTAFVPEAPQEVRAETSGSTATLTWSASAQAEKYRVYRDYSVIAETESTEHIDTITDVPAAHVYAVTAINEFGESDFSPSARVEVWGDIAPELIYDRVQADVDDAKALISKYMRGETLDGYEQGLWDKGLRGCYNTSDTNRVEYHTRELQSILNTNGYNIHIDTRLWAKSDIMRYSDIVRYLGNIKTILDAFGRSANAPELPSIDAWIDYVVANDIEKILYVTRELIYGALAMFRRAGTFTAGNDYVTQVIRRD